MLRHGPIKFSASVSVSGHVSPDICLAHSLSTPLLLSLLRTQVSEDERRELLQGLRANMADLQRDYLGLSVVADTASKKTRKKQMEDQLAQLEADIAKVERHAVILVAK